MCVCVCKRREEKRREEKREEKRRERKREKIFRVEIFWGGNFQRLTMSAPAKKLKHALEYNGVSYDVKQGVYMFVPFFLSPVLY